MGVVTTFLDESALSLLDEREEERVSYKRRGGPVAARGIWENIVDRRGGKKCSGLRQMMKVHHADDSVKPLLEGAIAEMEEGLRRSGMLSGGEVPGPIHPSSEGNSNRSSLPDTLSPQAETPLGRQGKSGPFPARRHPVRPCPSVAARRHSPACRDARSLAAW